MFNVFLELGFEHIADLKGYDHILFVIALCAVYELSQWKKVIILVTAFTIGHSITLALATLQIIIFSEKWIEFLIPLTIFITAVSNIALNKKTATKKVHYFKYNAALFFGLIHGLGFSNYLRSLLGMHENITLPLFAFNIGLELGQLFIVAIVMFVATLFVNKINVLQREWTLTLSGAALGIATVLMIDRIPF